MPHVTTFIGTISPQAGQWHIDPPGALVKRGDEQIRVAVSNSAFNVQVLSVGEGPVDDRWVDGVWLRASACRRAQSFRQRTTTSMVVIWILDLQNAPL